MFWAEIRKISDFFIWKFSFFFLVVKFSVYLNRHVFVMKHYRPQVKAFGQIMSLELIHPAITKTPWDNLLLYKWYDIFSCLNNQGSVGLYASEINLCLLSVYTGLHGNLSLMFYKIINNERCHNTSYPVELIGELETAKAALRLV